MWNELDGEVHPSLKDKYEGVANFVLPKSGLEIFRWWYGQANVEAPSYNVWRNDLGKLVYPTVFRDLDLFEDLIEGYDPITHQILDVYGRVLLKIGAEEIREAFGPSPTDQVTHEIDFTTFENAFEKIGVELKKRMLLTFVREVNGVKLPFEAIEGKAHMLEHYNETLVNTHTALF